MNSSDFEQFAEIWSAALAVYNKNPSPVELDITYESLVEFELAEINRALISHVRSPDVGQYPPKPADIVRSIRGDSDSNANVAWSKIDYAIRCVGSYSDVVFDDHVIHAVIQIMGGWIALCDTKTNDDLKFKRHEFIKLYRAYMTRIGSVSKYPKLLTGIENAQNAQKGFVSNPPRFIGDKEKAMLVLNRGDNKGLQLSSANDVSSRVANKLYNIKRRQCESI